MPKLSRWLVYQQEPQPKTSSRHDFQCICLSFTQLHPSPTLFCIPPIHSSLYPIWKITFNLNFSNQFAPVFQLKILRRMEGIGIEVQSSVRLPFYSDQINSSTMGHRSSQLFQAPSHSSQDFSLQGATESSVLYIQAEPYSGLIIIKGEGVNITL